MFDALQTLADNGLSVDTQNTILAEIIEGDDFEDDDDKRCAVALLWYRENERKCHPSDCKLLHGETVEVGGNEYLVLTNDEADSALDEYLEQLLDEEGMVPGADGPYFDREAWKRDAKMDGRGHFLAGYDGDEQEYCVKDGEWYYLYRQN
jgi:hypothetical protein